MQAQMNGALRYLRTNLPRVGPIGRCVAPLLLLSGVWFAAGCANNAGGAAGGAAPQAMPVQVQITPLVKIPDATEYLSILKSRRSANINPQVEGQIVKIFVKSGDHVTAGTPLMQIDPLKQQATLSSQDAARAAQEATVRNAKVQLDREQRLYDAKVVAKQDLDNAQTAYDSAVSQLKSLTDLVSQQSVELKYYRVAAPMDGIVGDVPVRVGDRVVVSTLLTTVDQPGALEAYIYVPADRGRSLRIGLPVRTAGRIGKRGREYEDYFYFAASGYGNTDGAGEGDGGKSRSQAAHCAANTGARNLGNA